MQDLRSLIERINAEDQEHKAETFRFMEEQKIKKALGPSQWDELKNEIRGHSDAIIKSSPVQLSVEDDGINGIVITNLKKGRRATLSYNPDVPCVFFATPAQKGQFTFRVNPDGTMLQFMLSGLPREKSEIAVIIISQVVG